MSAELPQVRRIASYALLGAYDFMHIIEAPDELMAAKAKGLEVHFFEADMNHQKAIEKARTYFNVTEFPFTPGGRQGVERDFLKALKQGNNRQTIGIYGHKSTLFFMLKLKAGVMDQLFGDELDASLRYLDVTVLTRLVFMKILGFDQKRLDNEKLIGYASTADKALLAIDAGAYDVAFIINPTRIEQVQEVARKGLIMPRKSTYFYPKVKSGLVMSTLRE